MYDVRLCDLTAKLGILVCYVLWLKSISDIFCLVFFFQAGDGIRDHCVTGVQTCALPIRPLPERLEKIEAGVVELIEAHAPAVVAVEDIFFAKHPNAALKLGHARGVVLLVAQRAGLPLHEYAPALVKRTVAGRGGASKEQVAQLVGALLGLQSLPSVDATDALAIAVTHLQASRARTRTLGKR